MRTLNLGILAHVDAGKTTLTERLLYAAGAIDAFGSVDRGTTQTDSMALERARGITIRTAVAAFVVGDLTVNLIDTPGHPDFIGEVERSLSVLDGAVLVVSAVEGVQAQTIVLMRALRRLAVPTLIFVNKLDRRGADLELVLRRIRQRLTPDAVAMVDAHDLGTPDASATPLALDGSGPVLETVALRDDRLLAAVVAGRPPAPAEVVASLAARTAAGTLQPVFAGSAATGAGVPELVAALGSLLPSTTGSVDQPASGVVFKLERLGGGRPAAYVRMFRGALRIRDRVALAGDRGGTVTGIEVFDRGRAIGRRRVEAGEIARVFGLRTARVGDVVGEPTGRPAHRFARPTMEAAVVPVDPTLRSALNAALVSLADQDPLIDVRLDDAGEELRVRLYGEVQKEVIGQTLADEFGIEVEFRDTMVIRVERPAGVGEACARIGDPDNAYTSTLGLRIEPGPPDSGLDLRLAVPVEDIPLYVFKTVEAFRDALARHVADGLRSGPRGWAVQDCIVTVIESDYISPSTTAGDVRRVVPQVVRAAIADAGTVVCEPVSKFHLEAPAEALSALLRLLGRHRAIPEPPTMTLDWAVVEGQLPAAELPAVNRELRGLTHGEGVVEAAFDHWSPVGGRV